MTKILTGKLLTATAFAAILAAGPVLAQDTTTPPATEQPPAAQPAEPAPPADPNAPAEAVPDTDAQAPATTDTDTAAAPQPAERFVSQQGTTDWLASDMIGTSVYGSGDENLGSISDLVTAEDGQVKAIVIGVGGFLGIGAKNVAVNISEISRTTDADGNDKFVLQTSKEELEGAPEFKTLAQLEAETSAPADTGTSPAPAAPGQM